MRILILISMPVFTYFKISPTTNGILAGVGIALAIILAEIIFDIVSLDNLMIGAVGVVLGLIGVWVLDYVFYSMVSTVLYDRVHRYYIPISAATAFLGMMVAIRKKDEVDLLDRNLFIPSSKKGGKEVVILDTSVIIDGRIIDVCETRFMTGRIIVPRFVLNELHALADSADNIKRQKGRRGLDILARIQEIPETPVTIFDKDFSKLQAVDAKLVELAKDLSGKIVTTDFNLNKIASLQGIRVLNINDLANALKAVVLPGEAMHVFVVKEGKEKDQGVAYLEDGTMVVVEDGRRLVSKKVEVVVTSILQTSAGRMVFTKPKEQGQVQALPTEPAGGRPNGA
ncbi:MAG: hypothetical protein A2901_05945 [Elusimicrobia bacterium RIFCSPLOWO2_01_FULL_54_10]|nr:MAG: hypothetical protein A2901_05945 [Elusimicrobia bacterium RIFCSPLOWO2_01_FULL_54_10]